ncbi:MAG TPA: sigma-E factor negative regulatory protein [Gammaproteobacteria bacterium]|nr:sigma-E factor negative regulatory protein [Gammaproteobacteria bacterium]
MSERLREQISALADDELPEDEHELLVRRFSLDKYLRVSWESYHLIGEIMRKELPQIDTHGFVDRIMKVLEVETVLEDKKHDARLNGYLRKSAVGMALVACVTTAAVYALRHGNLMEMRSASAPSEIVPTPATLQANSTMFGMPSNAAWNGNVPEVQAQLSNYVINHNETATAIEQQGMLPYFYMSSVQPIKPSQLPTALHKSPQQNKR